MQDISVENIKDTEINGIIGVWDSVNHCSYFPYSGYVVKRGDDGDISVLGVDPSLVPDEETDVFEWIDNSKPPLTRDLDAYQIQRSLWMLVEDAKERIQGFKSIFDRYDLVGPIYSGMKEAMKDVFDIDTSYDRAKFYRTYFDRKQGGE